MIYNLFYKSIGCLMACILCSEVALSTPKMYNATYSLKKNGIEFARSKHNLSYNSDMDEWCIGSLSYTVGVFSIKKDDRSEISCFKYNKNKHLNAIQNNLYKNNFVKTNSYKYKRIKSKKNYTVEVKIIDNSLVTVIDGITTKNSNNIFIDRLVAQLFGYTLKKIRVNDKGREREYQFEVIGKETIPTIFGPTEALIVKKNIKTSKRNTLTWYSIENNYVPVIVEQYRLNELKFTATLVDFKN